MTCCSLLAAVSSLLLVRCAALVRLPAAVAIRLTSLAAAAAAAPRAHCGHLHRRTEYTKRELAAAAALPNPQADFFGLHTHVSCIN